MFSIIPPNAINYNYFQLTIHSITHLNDLKVIFRQPLTTSWNWNFVCSHRIQNGT